MCLKYGVQYNESKKIQIQKIKTSASFVAFLNGNVEFHHDSRSKYEANKCCEDGSLALKGVSVHKSPKKVCESVFLGCEANFVYWLLANCRHFYLLEHPPYLTAIHLYPDKSCVESIFHQMMM